MGRVAFLVGGQLAGEDFAALGIDREVEFAPRPLSPGAVRLRQPLARAEDLQPGRVDHDVHRPAARLRSCQRRGQHQPRAAPRERGVVGDAQLQAEQGRDRPK